ncbi:hypothetical protein Gpo141_00001985 [Globisporangium polare]
MQPSSRAFKADALADLNGRCNSGRAFFRQQQRLLRVHLRHALLVKSYDTSDLVRAAGGSDCHGDQGGAAWMDRIRHSVAAEALLQDKQLLVKKQPDAALTNAQGLQQPARKLGRPDSKRTPQSSSLPQRHNKTARSEARLVSEDGSVDLDLFSTSRFISLEHGYCDLADSAVDFPAQHTVECDTELDSYDTPASTQPLRAFELVVELLSARDLAISSSLFPTVTRVRIVAELTLVHQTKQIAVLSAPSMSFLAAMDDVIHWDDAALRFGFDSLSSSDDITSTTSTVGYDPQNVINEWSLSILIKVVDPHSGAASDHHTSAAVLGKIEVPLVLLETPLAQEYAMARWFPLERTAVGVPTRGDIRVSITFSMRDNEQLEMVAYKPKLESLSSVSGEAGVASSRMTKSSPLRRGLRKSLTSAKPRGSGKSSPQRNTRGGQHKSKHLNSGSSSPPPPLPRGGTGGASRRKFSQPRPVRPISPGHRCPKVEAFSPPSSPSSFSSENLDEARSPRSPPASQQQPRRRNSLASKGTAKQTTVDTVEADEDSAAQASSSSSQPFLKRKPYKVVFRKLDWSSVGSRTDSSWDAKQTPPGIQTRGAADPQSPTGTVTQSKNRGKQPARSSQGQADSTTGKKSSAQLDPVSAHRLQALSSTIYECCHVSQATAPLAQMKYQSERTKYVQQLQSLGASGDKSLKVSSTAPSEGNERQPSNESFLTSHTALSGLWKALVKDASGELYATRLQQLRSGDEKALNPADFSTNVGHELLPKGF